MNFSNDLLYQVALTMIPQIGPVQSKILLQHCDVEEIFHAKRSFLERIEGIGSIRAEAICSFRDFDEAEEEIRFMEKNDIQPLFITDKHYPQRLLNCYDSPTLLYYKGQADLNIQKILAIIGTRKNTDQGRQLVDKLVQELVEQGVMVISGLAFGIDSLAHRAALKNNLRTVGVVAHGLDQIYPPENRLLCREMLQANGGILSEFRNGTKPDRHNFPSRNRIVAGMSDATIVVETDIKGGSMITAELANGYNREVFAYPGRVNDPRSAGCNELIRTNRAQLITDTKQILQSMGWLPDLTVKKPFQKQLFIELSPEETRVVDLLKESASIHVDELNGRSGLSHGQFANAIINLELANVVVSLPGKLYRLS